MSATAKNIHVKPTADLNKEKSHYNTWLIRHLHIIIPSEWTLQKLHRVVIILDVLCMCGVYYISEDIAHRTSQVQ